MGVRVFRSRTRLDVQGAGKILMNLMSGAAEEARTGNKETLSLNIIRKPELSPDTRLCKIWL